MFFFAALKKGKSYIETDGRIFNPGRTDAQEAEDKIPYMIIGYNSGTPEEDSKDSAFSAVSNSNVSLVVVAQDREALARLVDVAHRDIQAAVAHRSLYYSEHAEWFFRIDKVIESAGAVTLDPEKPCCWQTLTYQVECSPI